MSVRGCKNSPDVFCYVCGSFTPIRQRQNITNFVKNAYHAYFHVKLGDQDKLWAPHKVCRSCVESLRLWSKGKKRALPFAIPMVWRAPMDHSNDCYFCSCNVTGHSVTSKKNIVYPDLHSARRPVPHGPDLPVPSPPSSQQDLLLSSSPKTSTESEHEGDVYTPVSTSVPSLFSQSELNDLVRDLALTKDGAELLGSRLNAKNLLASGTTYSWYRNRDKEFLPYFAAEGNLVFCSDIGGLIKQLGGEEMLYNPENWRLFIDSSKSSLKGALLHNGNLYASVPVAHSVQLKETYSNLQFLLEKVKYKEHQWTVCGDLKVLCMLLGQQAGYTKMPCFLCEWDSRARDEHWDKRAWPVRTALVPGEKNIKSLSLVDPTKVLLPPLHIKLGLMKQFVKALDKDSGCFQYIVQKFPALSYEKKREGVFIGPQIRKLLLDDEFEHTMTSVEHDAWISFRDVVNNFLGNHKHPDYVQIVERMLQNFRLLGCRMSLKVHFLYSHLDYFPKNLGQVSEEQGERFHQDLKQMESRYQGYWNVKMMADYCWSIKRDHKVAAAGRASRKRAFHPK